MRLGGVAHIFGEILARRVSFNPTVNTTSSEFQ
jgi:hypothetical protein